MTITPSELTTLFEENPRFQEAWESFPENMRQAYSGGSTVDKMRVTLQNRIPILDRQKKRTDEIKRTIARFEKLGNQAAAGEGGDGTDIFKVALTAAGAAGIATVAHPNPDTFHCGVRPILAALEEFSDNDTRVEFKGITDKNLNPITVVIFELVYEEWKKALELTLTSLEENLTKVDMGKLQLDAAVNKIAEIGQTVLNIGQDVTSKRQRGILDRMQGVFSTITDVTSKFTGKLASQIKGVALKTQVWDVIEKAAKPFEDLYWKSKTDAERAEREVERARLAQEALKKCPSCDTAYVDSSSANCVNCGFPISPAALDLLRQ